VKRFEAVVAGGDVALEWELDADAKAELSVEVDPDVTGQAAIVSEGQGYLVFGLVNNECPECLDAGAWRPELVVSDGVRRIWAAATVVE
jgi:hypothetical protein